MHAPPISALRSYNLSRIGPLHRGTDATWQLRRRTTDPEGASAPEAGPTAANHFETLHVATTTQHARTLTIDGMEQCMIYTTGYGDTRPEVFNH